VLARKVQVHTRVGFGYPKGIACIEESLLLLGHAIRKGVSPPWQDAVRDQAPRRPEGHVGGWKMMGYTIADTLPVSGGGTLQFI
jgi:hypothetical protein